MTNYSFKIDRRFLNRLRGRFERYQFDVGVLQDKRYFKPRAKSQGTGTLQGGPIRKKSSKTTDIMVSDVSKHVREKVNFYTEPFRRKGNRDYTAFRKEFFNWVLNRGGKRHRAVSLLRAVIRNPLAKGKYGPNAPSTIQSKGFDRFGVFTGQLYRAIVSKVTVGRKNV